MDHCEKKQRKTHPRENANIFSLITFAYTGSLFQKAYRNDDLEEDDLYEVLKPCASKDCGDKLEEEWLRQNKKGQSPSIYKLMWARYGWRYILIGCVNLTWKIFNSVVEPWAFSKLISYFKPEQNEVTRNDAYGYASVVLSLHLFQTFYSHNYALWISQLGIEIKTALSSLLYRKALKLTPSAISEISLGNIVTLITKDIATFQRSIWIINELWIGMVQTVIVCYLLYAKVGYVSFSGVGVLLSILPITVFVGRYVGILRLAASQKTDERLQLMQEVLSTIRIIKMYTWEDFFTQQINVARIIEASKMLWVFYLKVMIVLIGMLFSMIGFYVLIMSMISFGYSTEAELIFYILSIFKDLNHVLGVVLPWGIGKAAEVYASIIRINKVLNAEELHQKYGSDESTDKPLIEMKDVAVHIKDTKILRNISFGTRSGLTVVTGTVGSGKSSLLKTILQDYPLNNGSLYTHGRISYASQDPWLFPSSIKQNILFGEKCDEKRYAEVVRVCALEYDFSFFEKKDETIVSDRGLNLSKGQQARVNLARAIYKDSEIYLLDDSLTALDAHVQDHIFTECIQTFLKDKICILVTQTDVQIEKADNVVIMEDGQVKYQGRPNKAVLEKIKELIADGDDSKSKEDTIEVEDKIALITSKPLVETEQLTKKKVYSEVHKKGEVSWSIYIKYVVFGGGFLLMLLNLMIFIAAQVVQSFSEQLLTKWIDQQQRVLDFKKNYTLISERRRGFGLDEISIESLNGDSYEEAVAKEQFTFTLWSSIVFLSTGFGLIKTYALFSFFKRASINIHKAMIKSIMEAVMVFFDSHMIGNILNRFSQDLTNIDEYLVFMFMETLRILLTIIGIVTLISIVNVYFLIFAFICLSIMVLLRMLYIPAGRSLKRLDASTRSPMVGHLNASLEGITTIRAYKAQSKLIDEYDRHQDLYTSANYISIVSLEAFGFGMDLICTILVTVVVAVFLFTDTGSTAGNVGLALGQVFMLSGTIQWGVRTWAELENLMTSVERLLEYTDIPSEPQDGSEVDNWPSKGAITYQNVSLTYNETETVLKNLNFTIEPQQKIGIVGRTGAGKSSIISSIFRLYDIDGKILIDDVSIRTLSLKFLRKKLAIIPQDPILFTGTVRTNLDPFKEFKDELLWKALEEVNIKGLISNLDLEVTNGGSNFSSGQKQLICVARAILRKAKIVILDEATANMDHETDTILHNTIKRSFAGCTVLTIAHRLHSILECDKVMVLDRGGIKEFDEPQKLLTDENGIFYNMVSEAGLLDQTKL